MTISLIAGLFLILVGASIYIWQNPQVLGKFSQQLQRSQRQVEAAKQAVVTTYEEPDRPSFDAQPTEQFADLRVGEFVQFTTRPDGLEQREYQVTATGQFVALSGVQNGFAPLGETYPFTLLDGEIWLLQRRDGWFVFNRQELLQGEEAARFNAPGQKFSDIGQDPGKVQFEFNGNTWTFLDVGYMRLELEAGRAQLSDQAFIKYVLAELEDGSIAMVVNQKSGSDWIWYGVALGHDLEPYLGKVIRAA